MLVVVIVMFLVVASNDVQMRFGFNCVTRLIGHSQVEMVLPFLGISWHIDVFVEIGILQSFVAFGVYLFKLPSAFTLGVDGQGDAGNGAGGQDGCLEVKVQSGMGRSVIVLTYHQGFNQRAVNRRTVIVLVARRPCKNGQ